MAWLAWGRPIQVAGTCVTLQSSAASASVSLVRAKLSETGIAINRFGTTWDAEQWQFCVRMC
eukprot:5856111-Pyramimonas_sp.AAC.1